MDAVFETKKNILQRFISNKWHSKSNMGQLKLYERVKVTIARIRE